MRVLKFGGTSVLHGWENLLQIVQSSTEPMVVVVSALAGVTKALREKGITSVRAIHAEFCATHELRSCQLIWDHVQFHVSDDLMRISYGEKCSAVMVAEALDAPYLWADASLVRSNGPSAGARIHSLRLDPLYALLKEHRVVVVTGFIAKDKDIGNTTLLQGSSDATACALSSAFQCNAEIYTDVDGMLTADPHIVPRAVHLAYVSKAEAKEMGFAGAGVIHPLAIDAAEGSTIEIINTFTGKKTVIGATSSDTYSVSFLPCETLISITDASLLDRVGGLATLCTLIAKSGTSIKMLSQSCSQQNISFVVDRLSQTYRNILVKRYNNVLFEPVSIVTVTGSNLKGEVGIASTIFSSVASIGINVVAIAQGSSELSVSFAVKVKDGIRSAKQVHQWLVEGCMW
jgi:aspartate kinase